MNRKHALLVALAMASGSVLAQRGGDSSSDGRWNVTGPNWFNTPCGHAGFAYTYGWPYASWRKPCSVPIRVCEYKSLTFSYPAEPDIPCERMARPEAAGELQRSYLKRWD